MQQGFHLLYGDPFQNLSMRCPAQKKIRLGATPGGLNPEDFSSTFVFISVFSIYTRSRAKFFRGNRQFFGLKCRPAAMNAGRR
jgi:hypothetical protein